jgi:hypothetical protein
VSVFTAFRRRTPEPTITGTGPYRLYTNGNRGLREQRFESLAAAMAAAGTSDPNDWSDSTGFNRIYSRAQAISKVGYQQKVIEAPGLDTEFLTLQTQAREADRRRKLAESEKREAKRKADRARWEAIVAAEKEKKAAEESAKPKLVISYLTAAGESLGDRSLAVEVVTQAGYNTSTDHTETVATCKACGESETLRWSRDAWHSNGQYDEGGKRSTSQAREWAQKHAQTCTAMPATTN